LLELILFYTVLLIVSSILSMSEISILTISKNKLSNLIKNKDYFSFFQEKKDKVALDLMTINFTWDYLGAMTLSYLISNQFQENTLHILIASIGTTIITLKVATLASKMFASRKPDTVLRILGRGIIVFYYLFKPISIILSGPVMLLMSGFLKKHGNEDKITDGELLSVLSMAKKEGIIADEPHELILNLIHLQDKNISELIDTESKVSTIDIEGNLIDLKDKIISGELNSKCVIVTKKHEENLYPLGVLTFKDIAKNHLMYACDSSLEIPSIASIMHPCVTTKFDEKATSLISKLNKEDHFVVVVNEFGVMEGVIESDDIIRNTIKV
jgi:putative hemolysin